MPVISPSWHVLPYIIPHISFREEKQAGVVIQFHQETKICYKIEEIQMQNATNMYFVNVHKNNTGKKKNCSLCIFYWILGTFHIPPAAITQLFIVFTSVPYPVKQWLKTSRLSVKYPKQKSVMPHNPCLTQQKENKKSVNLCT
jgi:hypothetical protein